MEKYKIGDKVKVREDLSTEMSDVVSSMLGYRGKIATIATLPHKHSGYTIDIDGGFWAWDESTLKPIDETTIAELKREIADKQRELSKLLKSQNDYTDCPMEFEMLGGTLALRFGEDRMLSYTNNGVLISKQNGCAVKTKIYNKPTPQDELEVGKWYVITSKEIDLNSNKNRKMYYHLYMGNMQHYYICGVSGIIYDDEDFDNWYEVVRE